MRLFRILLDPNATPGGGNPAPAAQPAIPNPHPAAVQPAPAGATNPPAYLPTNPAPQSAANPAQPNAPVNVYVQTPPAAPTAPAAPAGQPNAGTPPATASTHQTVTIPLEQLQAFAATQARLAEIEAAQRAQQQAAQQEQARILAQKGEVENALRLLREQSEENLRQERDRAAQIERDAGQYALTGELSRALADHDLVPGGAEQLTRLWRGEFTPVRENGTFAVRTPTYETPAQFVARMLADPGYAHFLRPSNPANLTPSAAPAQPAVPHSAPAPPAHPAAPAPEPRNAGEWIIQNAQARQAAGGDPRLNLGLPLGLKAVAH